MASFENDEAVKSVVLANTKFAFNLYREMRSRAGDDGNFVLAPFAISTMLAALYRGANEATAEQIKSAMKLDLFNLDDETFHAAFAELLEYTMNQNPNCNFTMLNGLFTQEGFPLEEDFEEAMQGQYQLHTQALDFGDNPDEAASEVRQWAETSTASQVKDVLSDLPSDSLMVVVNLAIFKGHWQRKFDGKSKRDFFLTGGESLKTSFLGSTAEFNHAVLEDLDAQAVAIHYREHDISLIVVLPNERDGLERTEEAMTGSSVEDVLESMSKRHLRVELPKFRLDFGLDLQPVLRQLEIADMFTLGEADMSGVDGTEALFVSRFMHRTILEIGEEGEVAASGGGGGGDAPDQFIANHPFIYFVRDNKTESILLMGRYTSPPPKLSDEGLTRVVGMSVKNVFKRMSSKEPSSPTTPTAPTSTARQDSSGSVKKQAPAPPSAPSPAAPVVTSAPTGTASYGATEQQAEVNPPKPPPSSSSQKKKSHSSLFFCCVKSSADDLDFDSV